MSVSNGGDTLTNTSKFAEIVLNVDMVSAEFLQTCRRCGSSALVYVDGGLAPQESAAWGARFSLNSVECLLGTPHKQKYGNRRQNDTLTK